MSMERMLHYQTVSPFLKKVLHQLMGEPLFAPFRLVGGTNLSLRYGHRLSVDIDLFSDSEYGSLDYAQFDDYFRSQFSYYDCPDTSSEVGLGRSYYVGNGAEGVVKIDLMYSDPFIGDIEVLDGLRMASVDDIVAMKMNVVSRGGRKKDFWDLDYLLNHYSFSDMVALHKRRYEWEHDEIELMRNFTNFSIADEMPDLVCLLGKDWDGIKLDLIDTMENVK